MQRHFWRHLHSTDQSGASHSSTKRISAHSFSSALPSLADLHLLVLPQSRVVATINQMILSNPTMVQFTKDTEWLSSLLAFIPRFEDSAVLGMPMHSLY